MSPLPSSLQRSVRGAVQKIARPVNVSSTERWLSGIAGTALAIYGISRRRFWGGAVALIGAGLAQRGATGHCDIYAARN
ncbi:MAG: YgaP-like transmembrane domain [Acidobacteriota bacterium]